ADLAQRMQAEKVVLELIDSPRCLSQCQILLEQRTISISSLLAATCLSKLVSRASALPVKQRIDIRNYILNYLASQPKLAPFVIQALVQVIAKITKLGWFEVLKDKLIFRDIIADVKKCLQVEDSPSLLLIFFSSLTPFSLVTASCSSLLAKPLTLQGQRQQSLAMQLLKLVLNCLNFDFIGSSADESADDLCTVQIPTNWRTSAPQSHSVTPLLSCIGGRKYNKSVHYLLTLWQRMVASAPFVKMAEAHLLDTYAPQTEKAYIASRLEYVPVVIRDGLEDPLDDTATVFQQLEQLCTVSRCEYEKTCTFLVQLFDQNARNYQKLLHSSSRNPLEIMVQEGYLLFSRLNSPNFLSLSSYERCSSPLIILNCTQSSK
uniref:Ran-binding protein 17 n=1 Tax=Amazona collaria TaxID=241587 RepID=A0A8B9FX64_9PSIT